MHTFEAIAEQLLLDFSLEEILEINDLSELEVLIILVKHGLISEPEHIVDQRTAETET